MSVHLHHYSGSGFRCHTVAHSSLRRPQTAATRSHARWIHSGERGLIVQIEEHVEEHSNSINPGCKVG